MPRPDPAAVSANAYAIAYRLLGDRSAAHAAVGIALSRLEAAGALERPDWLALLAGAVVAEAVGPAAAGASPAGADSTDEGLRVALRRRLASASDDERIAAALHHLAGYPIDQVAGFTGRDPGETERMAAALAPPPGIAYRELGDPELIGPRPSPTTRPLIPVSLSTVLTAVVVLVLVVGAGRCVGPRPRLGPAPANAAVVVARDVAAVGSTGCSLPPQAPGVYASTADAGSGGAKAPVPFRLAVPVPAAPTSAPTSSVPPDQAGIGSAGAVPRALVVAVADAGGSADGFAASSGLESAGLEAGGFVVTVAPAAHGTTAAVDAAAAVMDAAFSQLCVDRNRVTVTGLGSGGQTATALACRRPAEVAVVAAVGGASMPSSCELSPAVSLLMRWAADDQALPPAGGYGPQAVPPSPDAAPLPPSAAGQVMRHWVRAVGAAAPTRSVGPDGAAVEEARSSSGTTVRWVTAPSGGHAWTADDTAEVLAFAAAHARSTA